MEKALKCKYCGEEYVTRYPHKVFCSCECFRKYRNGEQVKKGYELPEKCLYCGRFFYNDGEGKMKFCSNAHKKAYTDMQIQLKICASCVYSAMLENKLLICDYLDKTGHSRPCGVNPCAAYAAEGKPLQQLRLF